MYSPFWKYLGPVSVGQHLDCKENFLTCSPPPSKRQLGAPYYQRLYDGTNVSLMVRSVPPSWCHRDCLRAYICMEGDGLFVAGRSGLRREMLGTEIRRTCLLPSYPAPTRNFRIVPSTSSSMLTILLVTVGLNPHNDHRKSQPFQRLSG